VGLADEMRTRIEQALNRRREDFFPNDEDSQGVSRGESSKLIFAKRKVRNVKSKLSYA
jgi:hypothetical protein